MTFPFGIPITVINTETTGQDSDGNDVLGEIASGPFRGAFDPAIGYESTVGGRDQVVSQPQAYLAPDVRVTPSSILVIDGTRYEVDGQPNYWSNPFTGSRRGVQVPLKRVTG